MFFANANIAICAINPVAGGISPFISINMCFLMHLEQAAAASARHQFATEIRHFPAQFMPKRCCCPTRANAIPIVGWWWEHEIRRQPRILQLDWHCGGMQGQLAVHRRCCATGTISAGHGTAAQLLLLLCCQHQGMGIEGGGGPGME